MIRRSIAIALFVLAGVAATSAAPARSTVITGGRVLVYGDSLMWESRGALVDRLTHYGWTVDGFIHPAGAVCDYLAHLQADIDRVHPDVITVEALGMSFWACMNDPATGKHWPLDSPGYYAKYRADFATFFATAAASGAKVVYIKPPPAGGPDTVIEPYLKNVMDIAIEEARKVPGVSVSDAARNAVSSAGRFVTSERCLSSERTMPECMAFGYITVRAPDGVHFCPVGVGSPSGPACTVYSSGEVRFGRAVANATLKPPRPLTPVT